MLKRDKITSCKNCITRAAVSPNIRHPGTNITLYQPLFHVGRYYEMQIFVVSFIFSYLPYLHSYCILVLKLTWKRFTLHFNFKINMKKMKWRQFIGITQCLPTPHHRLLILTRPNLEWNVVLWLLESNFHNIYFNCCFWLLKQLRMYCTMKF